MIKELINLANHLDSRGYTKEADYLDGIIKKSQQSQGMPDYINDDWIRTRVASPRGSQASRALQEYNRTYTQNGATILRGINNLDLDSNLPSSEERRRIREEGTDEERQALRDSRTQAYTSALSMLGRKAFEEIKQTLGADPREADMGQALPTTSHLFLKWAPIVMFGVFPGSSSMAENLSIDTPDNITRAISGLTRLVQEGAKIQESGLPNDVKSAAQATVEKANAALSAINAWVSDPSLAPRS